MEIKWTIDSNDDTLGIFVLLEIIHNENTYGLYPGVYMRFLNKEKLLTYIDKSIAVFEFYKLKNIPSREYLLDELNRNFN